MVVIVSQNGKTTNIPANWPELGHVLIAFGRKRSTVTLEAHQRLG